MTHPHPPLALCSSLAAIALALCAGCAVVPARIGVEHPEGCERLGAAAGEATAKSLAAAAELARSKLRENATRSGANYVELVYENHDEPGPYHDRTRAQVGGIAWRCPEPARGD